MTTNKYKYSVLASITYRKSVFLVRFYGKKPISRTDVIAWLEDQDYVFTYGEDVVTLFDEKSLPTHYLQD